MTHVHLIHRYQDLRALGRELNSRLTHSLSRRNLMEGGRRLGIARGNTLAFETEDEASLLMDYCIHDLRHDGKNAVDRFLNSHRNDLSFEQASYLDSLSNAFYSLFEIRETEPGFGVSARDLLSLQDYFIFDVGFSSTAHPGFILASRIFEHENITMTTGAALPVAPSHVPQLIQMAKSSKAINAKLSFKITAEIIRKLLADGASNKVAYHDVSENLQLSERSFSSIRLP